MPLTLEQFQKEFYEEAADWVLGHYTPEQRMKGLSEDERLEGIPNLKRLKGIPEEELLAGVSMKAMLNKILHEAVKDGRSDDNLRQMFSPDRIDAILRALKSEE